MGAGRAGHVDGLAYTQTDNRITGFEPLVEKVGLPPSARPFTTPRDEP